MAVDGEEGDAIVSAIGCEQELAAGMHLDFGGVVAPGESFWKCRNRRQLMRLAAARLVRKCGDAGLQFVDDVSELAVRMKGQVARPGAGVELGLGRTVRG